MSDVRVQCMLIGLGFDLVGYVLMTLPYLFMWDFTDEKHAHVMEVLKQRAEAGNVVADDAASAEPHDAPTTAESVSVQKNE